jgi:hypothetical protein
LVVNSRIRADREAAGKPSRPATVKYPDPPMAHRPQHPPQPRRHRTPRRVVGNYFGVRSDPEPVENFAKTRRTRQRVPAALTIGIMIGQIEVEIHKDCTRDMALGIFTASLIMIKQGEPHITDHQ